MIDWFTLSRKTPLQKKPRHPLSDPLENEEWRGLSWTVHLFSKLLRSRR